MFQFKKTGSEASSSEGTNISAASTTIRTFKEDLEHFEKSGSLKGFHDEIAIPVPARTEMNFREVPALEPKISEEPEIAPQPEKIPTPFQSLPTPPPISATEPKVPPAKQASNSFFSQQPAAAEKIMASPIKEAPSGKPKIKRSFALPLVIIFLIAIAGAGSYYYWFYIRTGNSFLFPGQKENTPAPTDQTATTSQNSNLRRLVIDNSQTPTEIKNAVFKYASDFSLSAAANQLIEVKVLGKDNQPIGKNDFFSGFGVTVPDSVKGKLSEDYSLFIRKQGNSPRLGLVFKTVTSAGFVEEMRKWEPTITADLKSLYLGQTTSVQSRPFSSNRYKNADIRYFNFASPADTSLDYSVISNYVIISTAKDFHRAVLDYMSEK